MDRDTTMAAKQGWVSVPEGLGEPDNCPMDEVKIHTQAFAFGSWQIGVAKHHRWRVFPQGAILRCPHWLRCSCSLLAVFFWFALCCKPSPWWAALGILGSTLSLVVFLLLQLLAGDGRGVHRTSNTHNNRHGVWVALPGCWVA